jgi:hypothetical protein
MMKMPVVTGAVSTLLLALVVPLREMRAFLGRFR